VKDNTETSGTFEIFFDYYRRSARAEFLVFSAFRLRLFFRLFARFGYDDAFTQGKPVGFYHDRDFRRIEI
jgi:hypothetical protein